MNDVLIWSDCETSGLEDDALIFEVAIVVTDHKLRELWSQTWLVHPGGRLDHLKKVINPYVLEMHTKNNLWNDLQGAMDDGTARTEFEAEREMLTLFTELGYEKDAHPLCGSTAHFDRKRFAHWMPELEDWFHYRNIDVSSVKELAKIWAPSIYNNRPGQDEDAKKHRGLDDVRASIAELLFYVDQGFIRPEVFDPRAVVEL